MDVIFGNKTTLDRLNIGLIVFLILATSFFAFSHVKNRSFLVQSYSYEGPTDATVQAFLNLRSLAEYKKIVSSRELFRPFVIQPRENVQTTTIDDITRDMMLVGVVSIGEKEAIIKNRRTRQTYFITEGSQLGELKVIGIYDDKIEVSYKNERKDLFLR
jgi:hypothetical protein